MPLLQPNVALKLTTVSLFLSILIVSSASLSFLQWGQKCKLPSVGGDSSSLEDECDAGKGLMCNGEACVCTYSQRYSYDHTSGECRRRVGKPCQFVDLKDEQGQNKLDKLPFNVKCHEYAECTLLSPPSSDPNVLENSDKISMCVCKGGLVPTRNFDMCIAPPPKLDVVVIPTPKPPRIVFRPAFFT